MIAACGGFRAQVSLKVGSCLVLLAAAWYCQQLPGADSTCLVLSAAAWYCQQLPGAVSSCLVLSAAAWCC